VTLPEVVTGNLAGKFGEISLYNQHADFELGSASNSNSTSPWAIVCESATQPLRTASPLHERYAHGPRNASRAHVKAPTTRRTGEEIVPEYDSDSNTVPGYNSDSNPLSDETGANRDARRERNRKRNEQRRRLRESLPIRNLVEALDQVESRVHTTPEQCLMSITTIARQAQGMRAGQVIAKLAEDAYFMRVNNRVTQAPPVRNRDNEATSRSADLGRNRTRAELPANPNRTRATAGGPSHGGDSAGGGRAIIPHRDPSGGGSDSGSSNHEADRRAVGEGDRSGRGHTDSHVSGASRGGFDARQKIEELRCKKASTASDNDGFPAFSARLRNLLLPEKF
jgi:hypothetical protein